MSDWNDVNEAIPPSGLPVSVLQTYRFLNYKPNSQQARAGILGRWQSWNGYGWANCEAPTHWRKQ